jgi:hypothetical protein
MFNLFYEHSNEEAEGCIVIVQDGLASVGILLLSQNPKTVISKLIWISYGNSSTTKGTGEQL